jgi:integrase
LFAWQNRNQSSLYIDEVFVKISGKQHYLWRAVDQDGEVVDLFLQAMRTGEVHGLKLKDVDFEHRQILVRESFVGQQPPANPKVMSQVLTIDQGSPTIHRVARCHRF